MRTAQRLCDVSEGEVCGHNAVAGVPHGGAAFSALDASPFSLLVPYGKGAEYIDRLDGGPELAQAARILRAAQRYTVTVYPGKLEQFRRLHCVRELPIYGSYALDKAYYDDFLGVAADRKEMGLLDI